LSAGQGVEVEGSRVIAAFADTRKALDFSFNGLHSGVSKS
jgi:hypothetical protein